MPAKVKIKGWVQTDVKPLRAKSCAADITSAPLQTLQTKVASDAAQPRARVGKSKLRTVFVRPARGSDVQAKLVIVDSANKPKFAQG